MYEENLTEVDENSPSGAAIQSISLFRLLGVSLLGMVLIGFICQLSIQGWFNGKVAEGVSAGNIDIGGLNLDQARQRLNAAEAKLKPSFVVAGKRYAPTLAEIGARFDTEEVLVRAYSEGRDGILAHPKKTNLSLSPIVDSRRLSAYLMPITKLGTTAVDARLEVHKGLIQVVPEKDGFSIDASKLKAAILTNLTSFDTTEPVISQQILTALIRSSDLTDAQAQAQALVGTSVTLNDGLTNIVPGHVDIANWLSFAADPTSSKTVVNIDPVKVSAYVKALAKRLDRSPTDKKVNIVDGVSSVTAEGKDGEGIDQEEIINSISKIVSGQPLIIVVTRHPVAFKTLSTNLTGVSSGKYIEINLSKQRLWAWDNFAVVYESPVTTGAAGAGFGTVVGNFNVYTKERNRFLTGLDYSVFVKYWMPFYGNYGMHDASWRNGNFGGQDYYRGGSHGCVNMPETAAMWLYGWSDIGTAVYVHK